jgi:hypothetical protein
MKTAKIVALASILSGVIYLTGCSSSTPRAPHSYSSHEKMESPTIFADGIISNEQLQEFGGVFTPEGNTFYFSRYNQSGDPFMTSYQTMATKCCSL